MRIQGIVIMGFMEQVSARDVRMGFMVQSVKHVFVKVGHVMMVLMVMENAPLVRLEILEHIAKEFVIVTQLPLVKMM